MGFFDFIENIQDARNRKTVARYMEFVPKADMIYTEDRSGNGIARLFVAIVNKDKNSKIQLVTFQKVSFGQKAPIGENYFTFYSYDSNHLKDLDIGNFNNGVHTIEGTQLVWDGNKISSLKEPFVAFVNSHGIDFDKLTSRTVYMEFHNDKGGKFEEFKNSLKDKNIFSDVPNDNELMIFVMDSLYYLDGKSKFPDKKLTSGPERFIGTGESQMKLQ